MQVEPRAQLNYDRPTMDEYTVKHTNQPTLQMDYRGQMEFTLLMTLTIDSSIFTVKDGCKAFSRQFKEIPCTILARPDIKGKAWYMIDFIIFGAKQSQP